MSDFLCAKTRTECQNATICEVVNRPLKGSIVRIRQEVGGIRWNLAATALSRELESQTHLLGVEMYPTQDGEDGMRICPRDVVTGELGQKFGPEIAGMGVAAIAERAIEHVISDLQRFGK